MSSHLDWVSYDKQLNTRKNALSARMVRFFMPKGDAAWVTRWVYTKSNQTDVSRFHPSITFSAADEWIRLQRRNQNKRGLDDLNGGKNIYPARMAGITAKAPAEQSAALNIELIKQLRQSLKLAVALLG